MSINDPQWGNSHRPEQKDPEQVPESTGTEPVQPEGGQQDPSAQKNTGLTSKTPPPEGPPDLEELWQQLIYRLRCRVARLLGRELPVPPEPLSDRAALPADTQDDALVPPSLQTLGLRSWLIGVSLIFGAWLVSGFYLVDSTQRGVLSRLGSVVAVEDPGWHWRWPYPIDSVRLVNVSVDRTLEVGLAAQKGKRQSRGLMLTADGNLVGMSYAVVYQVTDPVAYISRADDPADLLALQADSTLRNAVAAQTLATLLAMGNPQTAVIGDGLLQSVRERLQASIDPLQLGVVVKAVTVRDAQLPPPVLQAVKEAERETQVRAKSLRDAESASTENLIKARRLSASLQDESGAYARILESDAQIVRTSGDGASVEQARKALEDKAVQWRQQYPLVFASPAMLLDRVQTGGRPERTVSEVSAATKSNASVPVTGDWRDRNIMRSRDRVDRPGSGS